MNNNNNNTTTTNNSNNPVKFIFLKSENQMPGTTTNTTTPLGNGNGGSGKDVSIPVIGFSSSRSNTMGHIDRISSNNSNNTNGVAFNSSSFESKNQNIDPNKWVKK